MSRRMKQWQPGGQQQREQREYDMETIQQTEQRTAMAKINVVDAVVEEVFEPVTTKTATAAQRRVVLHNNKVYEAVEADGLYEAFVEVPSRAATPSYTWCGPRIPMALWHRILSFFHWSNDTHHTEAQVRLYVNVTTGEWAAWAYPQTISGMTTREIEGPDKREQRALFGAQWSEAGSVHHHCNMGAFQSGTDREDETVRDGLHITVGNVGAAKHSIHARVCLVHAGKKVFFDNPALDDWFEADTAYERLPSAIRKQVVEWQLCVPCRDAVFPAAWRSNMRHEVHTHGYQGVGQYIPGGGLSKEYKAKWEQEEDMFVEAFEAYGASINVEGLAKLRNLLLIAEDIEDIGRKNYQFQFRSMISAIDSVMKRRAGDEVKPVVVVVDAATVGQTAATPVMALATTHNGVTGQPTPPIGDAEAEAWARAYGCEQ